MAKSLRSKSKRAFRRLKREDPKSDYHIRDKIRTQRLSEKLKELKSVSDSEEEVDDDEEEGDIAADGDAAMEPADANAESASVKGKAKKSSAKGKGKQAATSEDAAMDATATAEGETSAPSKPVSTHGPRESARLDWRAKRGLSAQRKRTDQNSTTFKHKVRSYKSAGRAGKKGKRS